MVSKFWNAEIETMPRKKLEQLQIERLKKTVEIAMGSPFYAPKFKALNHPRQHQINRRHQAFSVYNEERFEKYISVRYCIYFAGQGGTAPLVKRNYG